MGYTVDEGEDGGWLNLEAIETDRMLDSAGDEKVVMVRHPVNPFVRNLRESPTGVTLDEALVDIANQYLQAVRDLAGIPDSLVRALNSGDDNGFRWIPLAWGERRYFARRIAGRAAVPRLDPRGSFWVSRESDPRTDGFADRTAVLLACPHLRPGAPMGGESGLRVVLHLDKPRNGVTPVRITGMTISNLPEHPLVFTPEFPPEEMVRLGDKLRLYLQDRYGLPGPPTLEGVSVSGADDARTLRVFFSGHGARRGGYAGSTRERNLLIWGETTNLDFKNLDINLLAENLEFFAVDEISRAMDPASRHGEQALMATRPTRVEQSPDVQHVPAMVLEGARLANRNIRVLESKLDNPHAGNFSVQEVDVDDLPVRSDRLSAVHSYMRCEEFFARLEAYGLQPMHYFRAARRPLLVRPRASLPGARDGETINAEVTWRGSSGSFYSTWHDHRRRVEVRFGAADVSRRSVQKTDGGEWRAQPLGLAADPRWAWHEFGHVLSYAAIGRQEFRFAHSAGDALAAIVHDPDSALAKPPDDRYRFHTFPWVQNPRQHGRDADGGWCWCGERNLARLGARADTPVRSMLGYFQEQVLSSSLFNLYRAIGGDTFLPPVKASAANPKDPLAADPGLPVRRGASDYVVYLIMRAISLLGPDIIVPARTTDQFVAALIDADIGTGEWKITANWPDPDKPREVRRVGGCVHKVIRWVFERQGLYAATRPDEIAEGPGRPPRVDIYIADRRLGDQPGDGGYQPVALGWGKVDAAWHAHEAAVAVEGNELVVRVGNRGLEAAANVAVGVRAAPVGADLSLLQSWGKPLAAARLAEGAVAIAADGSAEFRFALGDLSGTFYFWVSATCAADRSNNDPAAALPCGATEVDLIDLIANDNNQALCIRDR